MDVAAGGRFNEPNAPFPTEVDLETPSPNGQAEGGHSRWVSRDTLPMHGSSALAVYAG